MCKEYFPKGAFMGKSKRSGASPVSDSGTIKKLTRAQTVGSPSSSPNPARREIDGPQGGLRKAASTMGLLPSSGKEAQESPTEVLRDNFAIFPDLEIEQRLLQTFALQEREAELVKVLEKLKSKEKSNKLIKREIKYKERQLEEIRELLAKQADSQSTCSSSSSTSSGSIAAFSRYKTQVSELPLFKAMTPGLRLLQGNPAQTLKIFDLLTAAIDPNTDGSAIAAIFGDDFQFRNFIPGNNSAIAIVHQISTQEAFIIRRVPISLESVEENTSLQDVLFDIQSNQVASDLMPTVYAFLPIESKNYDHLTRRPYCLELSQYCPGMNLQDKFSELHLKTMATKADFIEEPYEDILVDALRYFSYIAKALKAQVEQGIYSTDIKPSNFVLDEKDTPKNSDRKEQFRARAFESRHLMRHTRNIGASDKYYDERAYTKDNHVHVGILMLQALLTSFCQCLTNEKPQRHLDKLAKPNWVEYPVFNTHLAKHLELVNKLKRLYEKLGSFSETEDDVEYLTLFYDSVTEMHQYVPVEICIQRKMKGEATADAFFEAWLKLVEEDKNFKINLSTQTQVNAFDELLLQINNIVTGSKLMLENRVYLLQRAFLSRLKEMIAPVHEAATDAAKYLVSSSSPVLSPTSKIIKALSLLLMKLPTAPSSFRDRKQQTMVNRLFEQVLPLLMGLNERSDSGSTKAEAETTPSELVLKLEALIHCAEAITDVLPSEGAAVDARRIKL